MQWLREHMQNLMSGAGTLDPGEKVLNFQRTRAVPATPPESDAVNLVYQAADIVRDAQERASLRDA